LIIIINIAVVIVISPQIAKEKLIVLKNKLGFFPFYYISGAGVATSEPLGLALGKRPFEGCYMQTPIDSDEVFCRTGDLL
jgi:hypothetical protein